MDLSVRLPYGHHGLVIYHTHTGEPMLSPTDDLTDWLVEHGGSLHSIEADQVSGVESLLGISRASGMTFHFTDCTEALLFKLTWL